MTQPQIEATPIAQLKAYESNPKLHPPAQIDAIKTSLEEFGWTNPVLIDKDNTVIAGHGRIEAATQLGHSHVPAVKLEHLTPEQARAYRIADNKLAEMARWDDHLLANELLALAEAGLDTGLTGFDEGETARILKDMLPEEEEPPPEAPTEPETKPGDVWVLGKHRLICGDSTDADTVARVLDGEKPTLMVTDPPYGVQYDADWRSSLDQWNRATNAVRNDDQADWSGAFSLSPADVVYLWHASLKLPVILAALPEWEPRSQIIWVKPALAISRGHYHWKHESCLYAVREGASAKWVGDRKQTTVWEIDNATFQGRMQADDANKSTKHSTQKPLECMERPIRNHSGDVYEPFAGSGTTIIAAERLNRRCFAIEIDPGYCDVIVERWQNHTGETAKRG